MVHWEWEMIAAYVGEMVEYMSYLDALDLALERDRQAANELRASVDG